MSRKQNGRFFESQLFLPLLNNGDIAEYNIRIVPTAISALETRKGRTFWLSDAEHIEAVQELSLLQMGLLMGAKRDIIREIRSARGDYYGSVQTTDPDIVGIGLYAGASLNDVLLAIREDASEDTIGTRIDRGNVTLNEIKEALLATGPEGETQLGILIQILGALL